MNLDKRITGAIVLLVLATAVILIAVFALDGGDDVGSTAPDDPFAIQPADDTGIETPEALFPDAGFAIVATFSVMDTETGEVLTATVNDDMLSWTIDAAPESADMTLTADDARLGSAAFALPTLQPSRTFEDAGDLEQFGLEDPTHTITFILDNGNEHTILVGREAPASSSYYVQVEGDEDAVHLISSFTLDPVLNMITEPPFLVPTPTPEGTPSEGTEEPEEDPDA